MLARLALLLLKGYQQFVSPLLHQALGVQTACRFHPTCSEYAAQVISRYGILYGTWLALKRLFSCQPFRKT